SLEDLAASYDGAAELLKQCKRLVHDALSASAAAKKRLEQNVVKGVQAETSIKKTASPAPDDPPRELPAVLDSVGIRLASGKTILAGVAIVVGGPDPSTQEPPHGTTQGSSARAPLAPPPRAAFQQRPGGGIDQAVAEPATE